MKEGSKEYVTVVVRCTIMAVGTEVPSKHVWDGLQPCARKLKHKKKFVWCCYSM